MEGWLVEGAIREDDFPRFLNHFHNPLATAWSQAGLGGSVGQSAILWAQNPSQSAPSWSWQDARQSYVDALTRSARADRDRGLAATFEALGRQMHLVQDASSPGHARNDPHILFNYETAIDGLRVREPATFERWRDGTPDTPGVPDPGWRSLDSNPLAPIAIARLVDTDRYIGTNPGVTTAPLIGLAEYTNANFFSEDRIFTENDGNPQTRFPFPRRSSVVEQDVDVQVGGTIVKRRYLVKNADGATGYRLATVGFLRDYHRRFGLSLAGFRESPALDETVYRDYAERLVPRAVTYSTALIDYFFRGRMFVSGNDRTMAIRNVGDEVMDGTFTLYYDDTADTRRPVPGASWTRSVAPGGSATDLQVITPTNPAPKEPGKYMLVFRGALGSEADAVVGKQVAIESVLFARLLKRKDGTPIRGSSVQAIDRVTGQILAAGTSDQAGETRLTWRPGRTVLFIPDVNVFPMYWGGGALFASKVEGAQVVQASDLDAAGKVTIAIPVVDAQWPEPIEECSGQPQFAHSPQGFFREGTLRSDGTVDLVTVTYGVNLITFMRDDDGRETILCGTDSVQCKTPAAGFVAEDVNHVGQVVGHLVRDLTSAHLRQVTNTDGVPLGPPVCFNNYAETDVVPVTVFEP
ncbi:MAG TPA: hypothetical protein VJX71_23940 [Methylomirabilota bacterium]|nr:hypothetical protein [Methylomirabilota bacterium]